jgi:DNA end-binding protein Ku
VCSLEDVEVPSNEVVRAYEVTKGEFAAVENEEIAEVQASLGDGEHAIEVVQFVDFASLNPLLFDTPYHLTPGKGGEKAYDVIRRVLLETRRVGIARMSLRKRPRLAALVPGTQGLSLETMRDPSTLREPERVPAAKAGAKELEMAHALVDGMTGEFDPTEHPARYRDALDKLVAKKRHFALAEAVATEPGAKPKVVDLMDALRRSLAREKTGGGRRATSARARASTGAKSRRRSARRAAS